MGSKSEPIRIWIRENLNYNLNDLPSPIHELQALFHTCPQTAAAPPGTFLSQITKALSMKYIQSKYTCYKRVSEMYMYNSRHRQVIQFKDDLFFLDSNECVKKYYEKDRLPEKMRAITNYYQYNIEVPRHFQAPTFSLYMSKARI